MATLAMLVPVNVENNVPEATASKASLPGNLPIHFPKTWIKVGAIFDWNITSPIRINRGIGRRIKLLRLL